MKKSKIITLIVLILGSLLFVYGLYLAMTPIEPTPEGSWRLVAIREERRNMFLALGIIFLLLGFFNNKSKINRYFFLTFAIAYFLTQYMPIFLCKCQPSGSPFQDFIYRLFKYWYYKLIFALIPAFIVNALVNRHRKYR